MKKLSFHWLNICVWMNKLGMPMHYLLGAVCGVANFFNLPHPAVFFNLPHPAIFSTSCTPQFFQSPAPCNFFNLPHPIIFSTSCTPKYFQFPAPRILVTPHPANYSHPAISTHPAPAN